MPEKDPAAGRTSRPAPSLRLILLTLFFLAFWASLLWLMGRTLSQLLPAALALDPAVLLIWLTLGPMTLHLAQSLFYVPPKPSAHPVFLGLRPSPLVFLPLAGPGRLEAGPAFFAAAEPGDRAKIMEEAEARLRYGGGHLAFLMADRSPLDLILRALRRGPWLFSAPARLIHLLTSPTRQLMRVWGFLFFRAREAWTDPGPAGNLTLYKRRLAWDLWRRSWTMAPPEENETEADEVRRLSRLRDLLAHIYQNPHYGAKIGEPWPEANPLISGEPEKAWLNPRYRGVFSDLPVTLQASSPAELYAPGRPEKNLSLFYPPELAQEAEDLVLLAAEGKFLLSLLADQSEEGLVQLDGRLRLTWDLAAELGELKARYDLSLKRIFTHHARCRAAHLAKAETIGQGWPEALRHWGILLWLAEHGRKALARARENLEANISKKFLPAAEIFYAVWADLQDRLNGLGRPTDAELAPPSKSNRPQWKSAWPAAWAGHDRTLAELREEALTGLLAAEDQVASGPARPAPPLSAQTPDTGEIPLPPERPRPARVYYPSTRLKTGPAGAALAALILALLIWQGWDRNLHQVTISKDPPEAVISESPDQAETGETDETDDGPLPDPEELLEMLATTLEELSAPPEGAEAPD